jgi:hypothetical protein
MTIALRLDGPTATTTNDDLWLPERSSATVPAPVHRDDLIRECKALRRGRGIFTIQIEPRIGPALRAVAGINGDEGPAEIRTKVAEALDRLASRLPADLRTAAVFAFALANDSRERLYKDRVSLVARRIDRDERTARRRIDDAIVQIAQLATAQVTRPAPSDGLGSTGGESTVCACHSQWTSHARG